MAMIVDEHDKTSFRESPCKSFQAVLLHTGIAVRHRNRQGGTFGAGNEQPTAHVTPPSTPNSIFLLSVIAICFFSFMFTSRGPGQRASCVARSTRPNERPRRGTGVPLQTLREMVVVAIACLASNTPASWVMALPIELRWPAREPFSQAAILPRATQARLANDLDLRSTTINE
jgi:hypothetical protein